MTRDEILDMPAGREMDALIAEKVMGWKLHPQKTHWIINENNARVFGTFLPSENISAAWEVVVKMENDDYWWTAEDVIPNSDPVVYSCTFSKRGKYYTFEWEFSMPLAICRAALLAVLETEIIE